MEITRRYFLQSTGALAVYLGLSPLDLFAGEPPAVTKGKTLVLIFLRGGADGLNLVVPFGDPHYYRLREELALPGPTRSEEGRVLDLDGFFGLNPRLQKLMPHFESGLLVAAHAVGHSQNTRSHFAEQDVWETGIIGNTINSDGWVNRHLASSTGHGPVRAVAFGDRLPRILQGKMPAFAVRGLEDLRLQGTGAHGSRLVGALEHAYCCDPDEHRENARQLVSQAGASTIKGIQELKQLIGETYTPSVPYPETELGHKLRQVAWMIKANCGLEVAEIDYGGWDTHQEQGFGAGGPFGDLAQGLGDAIAAFAGDLAERMDDVLLVTLSDFGRTAHQNGSMGTDHGWGNCMLALGGPVKRVEGHPRVLADWPGLAPDRLHQGRDLRHTIDFRDVLAELVETHLGNPNLKAVLPQHSFKKVGLVAG